MSIFEYKALDKNGLTRQGTVEALSENAAAGILQAEKFTVISIREQPVASEKKFSILNRITIKDLTIFSRQFAVMIAANVTMVQSLKILVDQTANIKFKKVIAEIADEVDSGSKLSDALAKRPKIFSRFYVSVVRSGETSGKLNEVLNYLAEEMEKDYDMMSKIRGAMIYPAFIVCGLIAVGVLMMVFVVPKLTEIIVETGAELPLPTRILIAVSGFMSAYWWLVIILGLAAVAGLRYYISQPVGRKQFDYLKLKLPIFGKLFQRIYLVRFTRSMNTLLVGGVTIASGLKVASDVVDNVVYQELIEQTIKEVEDGNSISSIFSNSKLIPNMVSQMMTVGEKTGKLDEILKRLTEFYSREIKNIVDNLVSLIEPIIMVVMGVAVAIMVAAIILPMYNMASQF